MKHFPFINLFSWFMGSVYTLLIWVVAIDVFSVSVLFSFILGLISLGITVIQLVLTKHLFYLLKKFIIMSKTKTPTPKLNQSEVDTKPVKTPKPKPKYRDVENNR
jgi:hypothetical protein